MAEGSKGILGTFHLLFLFRILIWIFPKAKTLFAVYLFALDDIHRLTSCSIRIWIYLFILMVTAVFGRCYTSKVIILALFFQYQCRMIRFEILSKMRICFLFGPSINARLFSFCRDASSPLLS